MVELFAHFNDKECKNAFKKQQIYSDTARTARSDSKSNAKILTDSSVTASRPLQCDGFPSRMRVARSFIYYCAAELVVPHRDNVFREWFVEMKPDCMAPFDDHIGKCTLFAECCSRTALKKRSVFQWRFAASQNTAIT